MTYICQECGAPKTYVPDICLCDIYEIGRKSAKLSLWGVSKIGAHEGYEENSQFLFVSKVAALKFLSNKEDYTKPCECCYATWFLEEFEADENGQFVMLSSTPAFKATEVEK